jgi:GntP family gluconate:H+ symporter
LLQEAAEKAGGILIIIGAGGAFGAVLAATHIGEHLSQVITLGTLGIFFPFLLTFVLKTAQGSSTVAIITAASIVQPLLPALGLTSETGKLLCVLSMGAGSMMISHANDAYFWVITKFSSIEMKAMLKVYSVATILMGLITLLTVYILSLIILN